MSKPFYLSFALALAFPLVREAGAQQAHSQIAVSGGVATDQRGIKSSAVSVAPSVTFEPAPNVAINLGGNATRFGTELWSLGGNAAFSARSPLGRFAALTLNGAGSASRLEGQVNASFAQAELVPALEARLGALTVFGGARVAAGRVAEQFAASPPVVGRGSSVVRTNAGAGPLYGVVLRGSPGNSPDAALQLSAREDRMRYDATTVIDRTVALAVSKGLTSLALSGGVRSAVDEDDSFGAVAVSLGIAPAASLELGAGTYVRNRVLGTPGGEYISAGLSFRFGGPREPRLPAPVGAPAPPAGYTRLSIRAPDARRVEVAGDFTEWKPIAAIRAANGVWYADLRVPPGQYRYAFRIDGTDWRVPDGATAVDDGFGGKSAWLTVSGASR